MEYPEIDDGEKPRHRFMSAYEQKKEAWDKAYQYLLFAAEPYEVIAFKVPNMEVDRTDRFFSHWCGPALISPAFASPLEACSSVLQEHKLAATRRCRLNLLAAPCILTHGAFCMHGVFKEGPHP